MYTTLATWEEKFALTRFGYCAVSHPPSFGWWPRQSPLGTICYMEFPGSMKKLKVTLVAKETETDNSVTAVYKQAT